MRKTLSLSPRTHFFIKDSALFIKLQRSRPSRARGLKHALLTPTLAMSCSRPSRARGLKLNEGPYKRREDSSRPSRARGLKLALAAIGALGAVRVHHGRVD